MFLIHMHSLDHTSFRKVRAATRTLADELQWEYDDEYDDSFDDLLRTGEPFLCFCLSFCSWRGCWYAGLPGWIAELLLLLLCILLLFLCGWLLGILCDVFAFPVTSEGTACRLRSCSVLLCCRASLTKRDLQLEEHEHCAVAPVGP